MRTIRENLEEAIGLLKSNKVLEHIRACELIFLDLSTIQDFPKEPISLMINYQKYLVEKHQSVKVAGIIEKVVQWFQSKKTKRTLIELLNKCQSTEYQGDGNKYLQDIFLAIRKAI
jgi:translation initiation factor IF-3